MDDSSGPLTRAVASAALPTWRYLLGRMHLSVATGDFATALALVDRVGAIAEEQGHHPEIDAMDRDEIRPFWAAVLDRPDNGGDELVDPDRVGPAVWFQQMDSPRPQRNRIHLDVTVSHDEAPGRLARALAAGGRLVSDVRAPAFWVLADAEGNEACICTWQSRD